MRCINLAVALLLCSTSHAALIELVGGSWTDGTSTAEYIPVERSGSGEWHRSVLTLKGDGVLSEASLSNRDDLAVPDATIRNETYVGFYDGTGVVEGSLTFDLLHDAVIDTNFSKSFFADVTFSNISGGTALNVFRPGRYTLSWSVNEPMADEYINTTLRARYIIPEPSAALLLLLGVPLWRCRQVRAAV